jgi:hypothetical protein
MRDINVSVQGIGMDFGKANVVARAVAGLFNKEPTVVAWHDGMRKRMSPAIEGADIQSRWRDYGAAFGGDIDVNVNGDFDFVFADTSRFESLGPSPYIALHDKQGHEYLCLAEHLRNPDNPKEEACFRIDENAEALSSLHEG